MRLNAISPPLPDSGEPEPDRTLMDPSDHHHRSAGGGVALALVLKDNLVPVFTQWFDKLRR
jgi:hypothetical protein